MNEASDNRGLKLCMTFRGDTCFYGAPDSSRAKQKVTEFGPRRANGCLGMTTTQFSRSSGYLPEAGSRPGCAAGFEAKG